MFQITYVIGETLVRNNTPPKKMTPPSKKNFKLNNNRILGACIHNPVRILRLQRNAVSRKGNRPSPVLAAVFELDDQRIR